MPDNALRCIEEDYPQMLNLAVAIGAIKIIDNKVAPEPGVSWDYIGYKIKEDGSILVDSNNKKYIHVNVRTPFSVGSAAADFAAENPEIASALGDPSRFFVTDSNGNPVDPQVPMRVFL